MDTPGLLLGEDRCRRLGHWMQEWDRLKVSPTKALYDGVEAGLEYDEDGEDPGQVAGDTVFTIASGRGLYCPPADQYGQSQHMGALADLLTFFLRPKGPWERPEDVETAGGHLWRSGAWLDASGSRLRRLVLVDSWPENRKLSESHSWRSMGEACVYDMPVLETILVIGQNRDGRRHSPWTKAWLHPVNQKLRMRKRDGKGFDGKWRPVWREEVEYNRETWIETMEEDGILGDVARIEEVPVPEPSARKKILNLIRIKLDEITARTETPDPSPSVCDWPSPCPFRGACWTFQFPSRELGFVPLSELE